MPRIAVGPLAPNIRSATVPLPCQLLTLYAALVAVGGASNRMFRDYKSSGWHLDQSGLQNPDQIETLLVLLSINYLWATVLGRWLCKSGRRSEVDTKKSVILVIFALGADWLIHQHNIDGFIPIDLKLYH